MAASVWMAISIRKISPLLFPLATLTERRNNTAANFTCRFANLVYSPEGKLMMDALWEETMTEFEFAGVRAMLHPRHFEP